MLHSGLFRFLPREIVVFSWLLAAPVVASEVSCVEDVCISGFSEAQGGVIEMKSTPSDFDPGHIECTIAKTADRLSFFDPNKSSTVQSAYFGDSKTAVLSCVEKVPKGTTGIVVYQCDITTQFSQIGPNRTLQRKKVAVSLTYPFLSKPYTTLSIASLGRNDQGKLEQRDETLLSREEVSCVSQHSPGNGRLTPAQTD